MKKILIIDDDADVREVLRIALTSGRDYTVVEAADGEAGLEAMRTEKPQLVLCDLKMPKLNGYQFLVRISKEKDLRQTPVIVLTSLTADSNRTDEEWRQSLGVAGFITKPFQPMDIVGRVDTLLASLAKK
jgi:CheY-like chemotaxis protein